MPAGVMRKGMIYVSRNNADIRVLPFLAVFRNPVVHTTPQRSYHNNLFHTRPKSDPPPDIWEIFVQIFGNLIRNLIDKVYTPYELVYISKGFVKDFHNHRF